MNQGCVDYPPADDIAGVFVALGFIAGDLGTARDNDVTVIYVGWLVGLFVVESRIDILDDLELFSMSAPWNGTSESPWATYCIA